MDSMDHDQEEAEREGEDQVILAVRELRDLDGDIEMNEVPFDNSWLESSESLEGVLLVLDTNILISHLPLLDSFVQLLNSIPTKVNLPILTIPHIILRELDGLKSSSRSTSESSTTTTTSTENRDSRRAQRNIGTLARDATSWLLKMHPTPQELSETRTRKTTRALVRGQRSHETLLASHTGERDGGNNDDRVLDCARFFQEIELRRVVLVSNDKNLCLKARVEGITTLSLGERFTASKLLNAIDTSIVIPATTSINSSIPRRLSKSISIHATSTKLPQPSSSHSQPFPRRTASTAMEVTPTYHPPPSIQPLPPPLLHPVTSLSSILLNQQLILHQFLAHLLAAHLISRFESLYTTSNFNGNEGEDQMREDWELLNGWKEWREGNLIFVVKKWWERGGLKEMCKRVLVLKEKAENERLKEVINPSLPPRRNSGISRWAPTSSSSPSSSLLPPPAPTFSKSCPFSTQRLKNFELSLPNLITSLSTPHSIIEEWSNPRLEVLVEELEEFLFVLLSGLMGIDLENEVREIKIGWLKELEGMKK